jgi:hypothetical protein
MITKISAYDILNRPFEGKREGRIIDVNFCSIKLNVPHDTK